MSVLDQLTRPNVPVLLGDGIVLRLPRRSDYEIWRVLREESRTFLRPWEPLWAADELSRASFRRRITRYNQDARDGSGYSFFIFDAASETLFGGITVGHIRRGVAQSCVLGYWMGERYAGHGYMRHAVDAVKQFAFEVEGLHRIEAACLPSNQRSIRLLERCGFSREGLLRGYLKIAGKWEDHCLYAMLAEEWSRSVDSASKRPTAYADIV
ncbi:GNAT family N-acetyltransferase [Jiella sp. MQZ9-1]|uniref:GNAT family N-acetyltransferase n=1 Tax=Jiella flava TaxID=2816857 RepID=A0A939FXL4_9HYPH|nr:GNAT family protein [Jiella flava]MBO0662020.1 GNAT family N-acetyltransferase [Jiella flava]MCD2470653.1 GNAT family N-acetyltransferase [Jiella flava]